MTQDANIPRLQEGDVVLPKTGRTALGITAVKLRQPRAATNYVLGQALPEVLSG